MAGLQRPGAVRSLAAKNPLYTTKYDDSNIARDAGSGLRTRTRPTLTLFVTNIPNAQTSETVKEAFANDEGFLQCRPVSRSGRRMVFVDYDSVACATKGLRRHQGQTWAGDSTGLSIDYDKDERAKRSRAIDTPNKWQRFGRAPVKRSKRESEGELFVRLKRDAASTSQKPVKNSGVRDTASTLLLPEQPQIPSTVDTTTPCVSRRVRAVVRVTRPLAIAARNRTSTFAARVAPTSCSDESRIEARGSAVAGRVLGSLCDYSSSSDDAASGNRVEPACSSEDEEEEDDEEEEEDESWEVESREASVTT
eukprot:TRINITY_DN1212_c0_g2_i1.p1 TRINITY_DN1212_c0_g2~~TRINITY_DN1212_c0_g2_i1.p1  ORF type:complete len:308 (+),score=45.37 TRINITY_DN1212_c0_g2_i1:113-1036(+)